MFFIGLGGFIGANLRYFVCDWAARRWGEQFPYGTLVVNVLGSFIIGLVLVSWQSNLTWTRIGNICW